MHLHQKLLMLVKTIPQCSSESRTSLFEPFRVHISKPVATGWCTLELSLCAGAQKSAFTPFDPPGSIATSPNSINRSGAIAGFYSDGNTYHGFLRSRYGKFTTFDPPGSTDTYPASINDAGAITGSYADASGVTHGFLRSATTTKKSQQRAEGKQQH